MDTTTTITPLSKRYEPELTADEEVGGRAGEEDGALSQGADQPADATKQHKDQAEG